VRDELQQKRIVHNTACMMLGVYVQILHAGRTKQTVWQMHAMQPYVEDLGCTAFLGSILRALT